MISMNNWKFSLNHNINSIGGWSFSSNSIFTNNTKKDRIDKLKRINSILILNDLIDKIKQKCI